MIGERVIMITGAAGHLGRAVAVAAQEAGASLVLLDRSADHARDAGLPEGAKVLSHFGIDLMDVASIGAAAQAAISRFGRLDGLVSTVGAFHAASPSRKTVGPSGRR